MAYDHNRAEIIGNLGRDPELQYVGEDRAVARFSVATRRAGRPGEAPGTDWHRIVCWGGRAEFAAKYLSKGRRIFVTGRLTHRSWETSDGKTVETTEIEASQLILLDRPPDVTAAEDAEPDEVPY